MKAVQFLTRCEQSPKAGFKYQEKKKTKLQSGIADSSTSVQLEYLNDTCPVKIVIIVPRY